MTKSSLLMADALVNLMLGVVLIAFPTRLVEILGVPVPGDGFYASILGAVLTGIGIALLIEHFHLSEELRGLGLGGAISINVCGAVVLAVWLVNGRLDIPIRGYAFLWVLVIGLLGLSALELRVTRRNTNKPGQRTAG